MRAIVGGQLIGVIAILIATLVRSAGARTEGTPPVSYGHNPNGIFAIFEPNLFTHNVGLLTLQITNVGIIGNPFIGDISAGWRGGEYLFDSGLWVGALGSDSEPHVSTARYPNDLEFRPEADPRWTVYESFEGVANGNRLRDADPLAPDDDGDGLIDEDFHDGYDDDGDGRIDEDFAAIGQQMFSCTYRDDTPDAVTQIPNHFPLGLLVRQRSFQWSTTDINEFVGFDFEIINIGDSRIRDVYLGFFSDTDAGPKTVDGYWRDDLVGWAHIDTTVFDPERSGSCAQIELSMDTVFMWDAPDDGLNIVGGDVPGVFGSLFLGHTTDDTGIRAPQNVGLTTVSWFSASGETSDPRSDDERYQLLSSGQRPRRNAGKSDDYRYVFAAGPFADVRPGESLSLQSAYVIGDGQGGFRANAVNAQKVFDGRYVDADNNPDTGVAGRERCLRILELGAQIRWDDPCDTLSTTQDIKNTPPCDLASAIYVDADCNPCTGIDGKEALINWVGTTAPPPPGMNTDPDLFSPISLRAAVPPARDREVLLQWDNASELRPDPITGRNIFAGYRIWRADNWTRPEGSPGPAPTDWMKIAEFWKDPFQAQQSRGQHLFTIQNNVPTLGTTDDGDPIYPVGRYEYTDKNGIINGKIYFYSVTAFGLIPRTDPVTGLTEIVELTGLPSAVEAEAVVPQWDAVSGCDQVAVVPNPYRGGAAWDLTPSERDPTGTKIAFRDLPNDRSTIKIYTLAGDLVREVDHDGRDGNGTFFWNLISRNGQRVVSGVYLYSVAYPGGTCRGRFVIIR